MDDVVVRVEGVSKDFVLPHERVTSIKSAFTSFYKRKSNDRETQHALKGIDFEIRRGEFFGIIGRNGSGKSTLLKILAGIYQPTKGKVHTNGKLVPFIELGVGFHPELTGRENVYLNGAMLGFSEKEVDAMYDDIVAFAELERFMNQKLKNYSSGMQVRLAFAVATRSKADILLVDEVLAVGDADFQKKCYDYFKGLKKTNTTVIFVTHDMNAVREYCDRAILIEGGVITKEGLADGVADEYLKLFVNKKAEYTINEEDRWGSGEVVFENIRHELSEQALVIDFDVHNKTSKDIPAINIGVNFHTEGQMIGGNGTKYSKGYERGVALKAGQRKHFSMEFANIFGKFDYTADMSIHTPGNAINLDTIKDAVHIQPLETMRFPKFFRIIWPLKVTGKED